MRRAVLLLPSTWLLACPASTPAPKGPAAAGSASVALVPSSSAVAPVTASSEVPTVVPGTAAVKAPVFSDDDCSADAECVPVSTCHPATCVAAGKAGKLAPGTLCTMDCRGGTLDCNFNHCGCTANPAGGKKCAVLPGPASGH
jgi:hypothetical protein